MRHSGFLALVAAAGLVSSSAQAQAFPGLGGVQGGLGGLAGNALGNAVNRLLPNVSSASTSNIAGVLNYCVQNNVVSGSGAASALDSLTDQQGVTASGDYAAGQQGLLLVGSNAPFSLADLKGQVKARVCRLVLDRAKGLL